jgi:hypothetical protein
MAEFLRFISKWRTYTTGTAYLFFLAGYVGSSLYLGGIVLLVAAGKYTSFEVFGAVGIFFAFAFPLALICSLGCIAIGSAIGLFSLSFGPTLLTLISYQIYRGNLNFGLIPFGETNTLLLDGSISEVAKNSLLFNALIILFFIQWVLRYVKKGGI